MAEYIKREDALDCFHAWVDKYGDVNLPDDMPEYRAIENLPAADVVKVIRCKDCIHRPSRIEASDDRDGLNLEFPDDWCPMQCEDCWYNRMPRDDFFCGYGKRGEKNNG